MAQHGLLNLKCTCSTPDYWPGKRLSLISEVANSWPYIDPVNLGLEHINYHIQLQSRSFPHASSRTGTRKLIDLGKPWPKGNCRKAELLSLQPFHPPTVGSKPKLGFKPYHVVPMSRDFTRNRLYAFVLNQQGVGLMGDSP